MRTTRTRVPVLVTALCTVALAFGALVAVGGPAAAAPPGTTGAPNTPTTVGVGIDPTTLRVSVKWTPAAGPAATSYIVAITRIDGDGGSADRTDVAAPATSMIWTSGVRGARYFVVVQAVNASGPSRATKEVFFTLPNTPPVASRPFTSWTDVVLRDYEDFLGRPPTTGELADATSTITAGNPAYATLVARRQAFAWGLASKAASTDGPVLRLYKAYFGRDPDLGGLTYWSTRLAAGTKLVEVSASFASSSEFRRTYGSLDNAGFLDLIYKNVLARPSDPAGAAYWVRQLNSGRLSRAQVMIGFSESSEYKRKQAENTDVSVAYIFLLGRVPTAAESSDWVTRQKAGTTHLTLLGEVLATPGYASHIAG